MEMYLTNHAFSVDTGNCGRMHIGGAVSSRHVAANTPSTALNVVEHIHALYTTNQGQTAFMASPRQQLHPLRSLLGKEGREKILLDRVSEV